MGAVTGGGPAGALRLVVGREQRPNYVLDTLECGHTVADYDNRRPARRRCASCASPIEAQFRQERRCLACGAVVEDGGEWCDAVCGREVLLALS